LRAVANVGPRSGGRSVALTLNVGCLFTISVLEAANLVSSICGGRDCQVVEIWFNKCGVVTRTGIKIRIVWVAGWIGVVKRIP
jgi:hypothetical protein